MTFFTLAGRVQVPEAVKVWMDLRKVIDCITVLMRRIWSSPAETASVESGLVGTRSPMPVPVSSPMIHLVSGAPFVNDGGIVHSMFLVPRGGIHLVAPMADQCGSVMVDPDGDTCFF